MLVRYTHPRKHTCHFTCLQKGWGILISVWSGIGYSAVILPAGLQEKSSSCYEAAAIDGAGKIRELFRITLPLLTLSLLFVVMMSFINSFQIFDLIYIIVGKQDSSVISLKVLR
ncbi:carbohydrate ABC transporter permease [Paenibacillus enshidis]|uniref:Carbohydrate ABC transporter permease n=1 Tax=Paenibacillus enshidis TaxID=1458439 RepID=A0ABV5AX89_9BACL